MPQNHNHNNTNNIKNKNAVGEVYHHVIGDAGVVILDRPDALNALNYDMVWSLHDIFSRWKDDPTVRHVVISSSSPRAFCVGGDIRQIRKYIIDGNFHAAEQFFQGEYLADLAIAEFGKPVIALCDGLVMGGGAGLAQHSSHVIMSETTRFAMPESSIGLFPDVGASLFLGRCPVAIARLLGMTGYIIDSANCILLGLAGAMVPSQQIEPLRQALIGCKSDEIDQIIEAFQADPGFPSLNLNMASINYIFSGEGTPEEMQERAQNLMRLRPNDPFLEEVTAAFAERCPVSIKVFWRLLQIADGFIKAEEAISLDYHLALRMIRRSDFVEGVRALLLDKDQEPKWVPNRLDLVNNDLLSEVFNEDGLPLLR
jgi:enoyl-CoA hydratase/carnithine racemase